ncbi:phosphatase PAP2 family protein [Sphingobium yanoikuyae]|nr:phosphatase PAP2 family protein [Sphingobium yanoikuyae]
MLNIRSISPEIFITLVLVTSMFLFSVLFDLPIIIPSGERAAYVGVHYLYPLIGIAILGGVTFLAGRREIAIRFLVALPCYVAILFAHFNIKLWIPHINPTNFDEIYWKIDSYFRPIVDVCMYIREKVFFFIPYQANFYMISYIALFYCSFCYHAIKTPEIFGKLIIAALLLQALGTLAYLVAPAVGPFIYEAGLNPMITGGQSSMLNFHAQSLAGGPQWLAENGSANFTVGLAAMPSLHSASAFLFFLFAWHHGKILLPLYGFILLYILVMAVASRWHYLIDVPVGMLIAWVSYKLAERFDSRPSASPALTNGVQTAQPVAA